MLFAATSAPRCEPAQRAGKRCAGESDRWTRGSPPAFTKIPHNQLRSERGSNPADPLSLLALSCLRQSARFERLASRRSRVGHSPWASTTVSAVSVLQLAYHSVSLTADPASATDLSAS